VAGDPIVDVEDPIAGVEESLVPHVTEPDGDQLTFTLLEGPSRGELTLNPDGTYTYVPELGDEGEFEFEYQVCDNGNPILCDVGTVTLIVPPLEGSDSGCESALPYACENFPVNMVMTPNFDGFRDVLEITGIEFYPNVSVVIYNRWGNLVWEGERYDNESRVFGGNANAGSLNNSELPDGTYFFIIKRNDGTNYPLQQGFVHIQR
jgi:gliding motility-associated-like protein